MGVLFARNWIKFPKCGDWELLETSFFFNLAKNQDWVLETIGTALTILS
jgi:hypothetical protein